MSQKTAKTYPGGKTVRGSEDRKNCRCVRGVYRPGIGSACESSQLTGCVTDNTKGVSALSRIYINIWKGDLVASFAGVVHFLYYDEYSARRRCVLFVSPWERR